MSHDDSGRRNIGSGGPWEARFGYSRAVRVGNVIHVSGTTSMTPEGFVGENDAHAQAAQVFKTIAAALGQAGASLSDLVRTRMYIVRLEDAEPVGLAHGEVFRDIRPASTMVQIAGLVDARMLVEIEAEALLV